MRPAADDRALFALLGVDATTPWDDVRRAFRAAVRASHPDLRFGDPAAEERLKTLNAAWESINTPSKWAAYVLGPASRSTGGPSVRGHGATPVPTVGRFRVHRARRGSAGLSRWQLELDGDVVTSIENGGISVLEARPGRHRLRVFCGSQSSLPLEVDVRRGEELMLGCRQHESLRTSLLSPKRALVLEPLGSRPLHSAFTAS